MSKVSYIHAHDHAVVSLNGELDWDAAFALVDTIDTMVETYFYRTLELVVSSPGGDTDALHYCLARLDRLGGEQVRLRTRVLSFAASAAAIIVSSGEERIVEPGARLAWHGAQLRRTEHEVDARATAALASALTAADDRLIDRLVSGVLATSKAERPSHRAERSDRRVLELLAEAVRGKGEAKVPRKVRKLARAVGRVVDRAVRDADRKALSNVYRHLFELDATVSAELAVTGSGGPGPGTRCTTSRRASGAGSRPAPPRGSSGSSRCRAGPTSRSRRAPGSRAGTRRRGGEPGGTADSLIGAWTRLEPSVRDARRPEDGATSGRGARSVGRWRVGLARARRAELHWAFPDPRPLSGPPGANGSESRYAPWIPHHLRTSHLTCVRTIPQTAASSTEVIRMADDGDLRHKIEQRLAADRAELTRLLAEQTRIKECVRDTTKRIDLLAGLIEGAPSESEAPRRPSRVNGELKPGSRIALAYEYLSEAGESLHIRDILVGIGAGDSSRTRDALATQINRYVASGRLFRQDVSKGPRVFGVLVDGEPGETPT